MSTRRRGSFVALTTQSIFFMYLDSSSTNNSNSPVVVPLDKMFYDVDGCPVSRGLGERGQVGLDGSKNSHRREVFALFLGADNCT